MTDGPSLTGVAATAYGDFDIYRNKQSVTFQQGVLNSQGTQDTWINEASGGKGYGNNSTCNVDDDTNNSFFSDSRGQGLHRFDNMFTLDGANNKVPQGATITNATLRLVFEDDVVMAFMIVKGPEINHRTLLRFRRHESAKRILR